VGQEIRYEMVVTGEVEVIQGPLSKIRTIAEEALADPDCTESVAADLHTILTIIDGG
jgi:hypothetical protein